MSDFIKQKLGVAEFTNGHAFYEFTREEDLEYYKEVIFIPPEVSILKEDAAKPVKYVCIICVNIILQCIIKKILSTVTNL